MINLLTIAVTVSMAAKMQPRIKSFVEPETAAFIRTEVMYGEQTVTRSKLVLKKNEPNSSPLLSQKRLRLSLY